MIESYRNSELPEENISRQKKYREASTGSDAILLTCDAIKNAINSTRDFQNTKWIDRLINPLKILEVLLYNEEQMRFAFNKGEMIGTLCLLLTKMSS